MLLLALFSKALWANPLETRWVVYAPEGVAELSAALGARADPPRPLRALSGWYAVEGALDEGALLKIKGVRSVSQDHPLTLLGFADEPSFAEQWALENTAQLGGLWGADVGARAAWDQGADGEGVLVAVLDTGVDLDHPELVAALWKNPGEVPGNGVDDDENGWVDDYDGVDVPAHSGDPEDVDGHGTAVSGLIAAAADGRSIVGLAPRARILPVRLFGSQGGFESDAAEGIAYAVAQGADVISCSWTHGEVPSPVVLAALRQAEEAGALVVAAAGNTPRNADLGGAYPARYELDALISVAASDRYDQLVYFPGLWGSAWGATSVDLAAPGEWVRSTQAGGGYGPFDGTSAATPLVSAAAALVWSAVPALRALEVKHAILASAEPLGHPTVTGGRLDAGRAVALARGASLAAPSGASVALPLASDRGLWLGEVGPSATWWFSNDGERYSGEQVLHGFSPGVQRGVVTGIGALGERNRAVVTVARPISFAPALLAIESPHPSSTYGVRPVELGETPWSRLHFERIQLATDGDEHGDDTVMLLDEHGYVAWSFTGEADDLWTPAIPGGSYLLAWRVALPSESWGFSVDGAEVAVQPAPSPPSEAPGGCDHLGSAPFLVGLLGLRWRRSRG